jgi:hypothetical protein
MEYTIQGHKYSFSYQDVREHYHRVCDMTDAEFVVKLPEIIHLACAIAYFKEIPTYVCLSDKGIIHELAHLLHIPDEPNIVLSEIRELFKDQMKLS